MANYQPLPPHIHHHTTRLTHQTAHTHLSTFLSLAENNAAYRPDSTLSERGPISSTSGSNTNLTLHHLSRIQQGLTGKRVGGADDLEKYFAAAGNTTSPSNARKRPRDSAAHEDISGQNNSARKRRSSENVRTDPQNGPFILPEQSEAEADLLQPQTPTATHNLPRTSDVANKGWQLPQTYATDRSHDMVDTMNEDRLPGAHLNQPDNEREAAELVAVEVEGTGRKVDLRPEGGFEGGGKELSKEERRKRKKERRKDERRRKND